MNKKNNLRWSAGSGELENLLSIVYSNSSGICNGI